VNNSTYNLIRRSKETRDRVMGLADNLVNTARQANEVNVNIVDDSTISSQEGNISLNSTANNIDTSRFVIETNEGRSLEQTLNETKHASKVEAERDHSSIGRGRS